MYDPYYFSREREKLKERVMNIINEYLTGNRINKALRLLAYLGDDHGYLKSNGIDMNIVNHYLTGNNEIIHKRCQELLPYSCGKGKKNYNINRFKFFKDIPDGVEILIDYVDVTAIRTMSIPLEIIYESIYRELPELFEE